MDSEAYLGEIEINPSMVSFWERDPRSIRATWYLSIAYAIKAGELTFDDLRKYRKDYRESKRYKSYLRSNPNHNEKMFAFRQEQLSNQLCESEEDRIEREFILKVKVTQIHYNLYRNLRNRSNSLRISLSTLLRCPSEI